MKRPKGTPHRRVRSAVAQIRAARIALLPVVELYQRDPYKDHTVRALLESLLSGARQYRRCHIELHNAIVGDLTIPKRTRVYFRECVMQGHLNGCGTIVLSGCMIVQKSVER